jgi:TolB-like protein
MKAAAMFLLVMAWSISAYGAEPNQGVLLLPFAPLGEEGNTLWVGQAVQQNLLSELSRVSSIQPIAPIAQSKAATDTDEALQAGQAAKATYVVFGSYQISEAGLRLTGQVLEVSSGRLIGGMKATGTLRDLFFLEDTLAEQAKRILAKQLQPQPAKPAVPETPAAEASDPPQQQQQQTPWQRDTNWIERTQLRERYDANYYRARYWYIYGTPPGWYGYSPYYYGYGFGPYYGTNGWAYQGRW